MTMQDFWSLVATVIERSNLVIEVIDARMMETTRNLDAERLVESMNKKLVIVANKADFLPKELQADYRRDSKYPLFFVSVRERLGLSTLRRGIFEAVDKRMIGKITVGVIGYPNTGKSSLINALCGRHATIVGSRPGMTRHRQLVRMSDDVLFIDTPGVIPLGELTESEQLLMNVIAPSDAKRLDIAAEDIVRIYLEKNKPAFEKNYGVRTDGKSFGEIVQDIGAVKKLITKGNKVDERRVFLRLIDDWQKGKYAKKSV